MIWLMDNKIDWRRLEEGNYFGWNSLYVWSEFRIKEWNKDDNGAIKHF